MKKFTSAIYVRQKRIFRVNPHKIVPEPTCIRVL